MAYFESTTSCSVCGEDTGHSGMLCDSCNEYADNEEYEGFQDVSPEQLAGEMFEDKLAMYRKEY